MNNSEKLFNNLYTQHFDRIFRFVTYRIPDQNAAEDIVAEVFTSLWQNINSVDESNNVRSFLYSIAKNKINDYLRKVYKLEFVNLESEFFDDLPEDNKDESKNEYPFSILEKLLQKLDEKEKAFYKLKYKQNFSYTEIANELEITVNNAKVINNRLLKKLKNLWNQTKI